MLVLVDGELVVHRDCLFCAIVVLVMTQLLMTPGSNIALVITQYPTRLYSILPTSLAYHPINTSFLPFTTAFPS